MPLICLNRFSLIDAWVSGYLLVLVHHASDKSQLRSLLMRYPRLVHYVKRIEHEQAAYVLKEHEKRALLSISSSDNAVDIVTLLHVASQIVSFSIFLFMLTRIGANSYGRSA
jgi:hypothetical protein